MNKAKDIDEFISTYPPETQKILEKIRSTIKKSAPTATEAISYGIPTFKLHGNLVHFSAYEKHIGFYPGASGIARFAKELRAYETSKGTVRFPINAPIPYELIAKITEDRVRENSEK